MSQICKACNTEKALTEFWTRRWRTSCGELREAARKTCKLCELKKEREKYKNIDSVRRLNRKQHHLINKQKNNEYSKKYYSNNKDKWLNAKTGWRFNERAKQYDIKYRTNSKTKERIKIQQRNWRQRNKPHLLLKARKRQLHIEKATPLWANTDAMLAIYKEAERMTLETGIKYEVDHYYPLQGRTICGLHVENNLQILPATENRKKHNKMPKN